METPPSDDPAARAVEGGAARLARDRLPSLVLAAALALGLLRFVRLGDWSLWLDEVLTWGDAHDRVLERTNFLGYLLIRWTVEVLGGAPTEVALRVAPALAGYMAIPLTWWAFRPLAGERRSALAALLVAVSAWEIQWSQTARFYTFVQLAALVGAGVGVRGLASSRVVPIVCGIALIGAGIAFHLQAAIVAAAFGTAALIVSPFGAGRPRRAARNAFLVFAVPGVLASPIVLRSWSQYAQAKGVGDAIQGIAHFVLSTGSFVTPLVGALGLAGLVVARRDRDRAALFVVAVPVLGLGALCIAAAIATTSAQYAFAFFPWFALLAAWPVDSGERRRAPYAAIAWVLVAALPALAASGLYLAVHHGQRARWKEATALVEALRDPGDVVLGVPANVVEFYLTGAREKDVRVHDSVVQLDRHQPRSYEPYARSGRRIWLVVRTDYLNALDADDRREVRRFLREECRLIERFPVFVEARDLAIEVWRGPE